MGLPSIYSRRAREMQKNDGVYFYDDLPSKLRIQFIQILDEAFGSYDYDNFEGKEAWQFLVKLMRKELGTFQLARGHEEREEAVNWFLNCTEIEPLLDAVEIGCRIIDKVVRDSRRLDDGADDLLAELNARFQEAAVGFQYESGQLIRIDSLVAHTEIVIPALKLLSDTRFSGANSEFLEAHAQLRAGKYEQCLTECCKALESVLKTIGLEEGWTIAPTDPISKLLKAAFDNNLIPPYLQSEFDGLKSVLQSGVPTLRNKTSGHGTGAVPRKIPSHLAAFQLHQTAAAILFIVSSNAAKT